MKKLKTTNQILGEIKNLTNSKGYIYVLCMIIVENLHITLEKMHKFDSRSHFSIKEVSLLIGFLVQNKIDLTTPNSSQDLIALKKKTHELMEELHQSFSLSFHEKLQENIKKEYENEDDKKWIKDFFNKRNMFVEPIFYSGDGVFDFQYLDFLEKKYKYDKEWLLKNKGFDIEIAKNISIQIKNILQEKSQKIRFFNPKKTISQVVKMLKKKIPDEDLEKSVKEVLPLIQLYQYKELFPNTQISLHELINEDITEEDWKLFYENLIKLFMIRKLDFDKDSGIDSLLQNFSLAPKKGFNSHFQGIGNFNEFNAKPIIQLDEERYFVPITFSLFESVYESPFYWMWEDKQYRDKLGESRGETGEEITYDFLSQVFGKKRTFKSVRINTKKGQDDTDIDILCILGSKALCVQVKSKKLTALARKGNDEQLKKDFKGAVQDAYEQGLISRQKILDRSARFFDENEKEIQLTEEIDEVYIMGITTENYPSLTHQSHIMLDKKEGGPYPIFLTIFDLELLTHYLSDPYDFLYYIRQRISLMDYFIADEEIVFLSFHIQNKLWKIPEYDIEGIDPNISQSLIANYFLEKSGLEAENIEVDVIGTRWKNEDFDKLCNQLKISNEPKVTDIIFHLLDLSSDSIENLIKSIQKTNESVLANNKPFSFSMLPKEESNLRIGITYFFSNSGSIEKLNIRLLASSMLQKYQTKSDVWIGLGKAKNNHSKMDTVLYLQNSWEYDERLESLSRKQIASRRNIHSLKKAKVEVGRNEKCPCGSDLKYKKCCG